MRTVLIADDERTIREGIRGAIDWNALGVSRVVLAANGREAYESIRRDRPDVALVDIVMPELTGIEVIARFKGDGRAPEFVIISGHEEFDFAREALRHSVRDYLVKPCDPDEIEASISRAISCLEERRSQAEEQERLKRYVDALLPKAQEQALASLTNSAGQATGIGQNQNADPHASFATWGCEGEYTPPIRQTLRYVQEHLGDRRLTLSYLATNVLYLNPDYLGRLFKKECGIRFSEYLMTMRMERAKQLLASSPDLKVHEVARQVGLGRQPAYFGQLFRKYTGVLPSEYRAMRLED